MVACLGVEQGLTANWHEDILGMMEMFYNWIVIVVARLYKSTK